MSLYESGESNGRVSLKRLFGRPEAIGAQSDLELREVAFLICRGGWPFATFLEGAYALAQARDYYEALVHQDISRVDGVERNPQVTAELLRSYARHQGGQVATEEIARDLAVDPATVRSYVGALTRLFAIEDMEAWNPNLRSKVAIRTSNTRYFVDPSLATNALHVGPEGLMADLNTFGLLFETLCVRDLRVYAEPLEGKIYHYRDKSGLECDAVVVLPDGRYGLVEVKLGQDAVTLKEASKKLAKLKKRLEAAGVNEPAFMAVVTANGTYAYRQAEDGIYIVPIGCLAP